jgi:hypothetical protein
MIEWPVLETVAGFGKGDRHGSWNFTLAARRADPDYHPFGAILSLNWIDGSGDSVSRHERGDVSVRFSIKTA